MSYLQWQRHICLCTIAQKKAKVVIHRDCEALKFSCSEKYVSWFILWCFPDATRTPYSLLHFRLWSREIFLAIKELEILGVCSSLSRSVMVVGICTHLKCFTSVLFTIMNWSMNITNCLSIYIYILTDYCLWNPFSEWGFPIRMKNEDFKQTAGEALTAPRESM